MPLYNAMPVGSGYGEYGVGPINMPCFGYMTTPPTTIVPSSVGKPTGWAETVVAAFHARGADQPIWAEAYDAAMDEAQPTAIVFNTSPC